MTRYNQWRAWKPRLTNYTTINPGGGGGGGGYSPQILVGMSRGKVKNGQGLRNELPVERKNAGLRNELDPFWAWKWESSELPGRVWLTRGAAERCVRAEPAVGGDERVEIKEILKMMVSGKAKSAKRCKMVMLRNGFFLEICENDMLRYGNSGLKMGVSRAAHTRYAYMEVYPPPPPPGNNPFAIIMNYWLKLIRSIPLYLE